jgi:hypothetical protein
MATVGLQGIWGLEQLDRKGLSNWRLLIIMVLVADFLGLALAYAAGLPHPESPLASYYTAQVTGLTILFVTGMSGLTLALNIMLARTTEADLRSLPSSEGIDSAISGLKPRASLFVPIVLAIMLMVVLASPVLASQRMGISLWAAIVVFIEAGPPLQLLFFFLWPLIGVSWGVGFAIGVTQIISLIKAARAVHIDLFHLEQYSTLANPTIRVILCIMVTVGMFPLGMFIFDDPVVSQQIGKLMVMVILPVIPALFGWVYPILILRNRIKLKKAEELDLLRLAINGEEQALTRSCIPKRGTDTTTADLLTHQMFIESRWEWPIAAHVQKLVAFGLLPPLTWVLAALVEHSFF